jgi:hypothetical protein
MSDRIGVMPAITNEIGRGLLAAGRICLVIVAGLLAVLLVVVVREARAQVEGREHVLAGVGHVLAAAIVAGLAMVAWLAGILAEILALGAAAGLVIALTMMGWHRLAPFGGRSDPGPVVLRLLAGPLGRRLGVDRRAKRLLVEAGRRDLAGRSP